MATAVGMIECVTPALAPAAAGASAPTRFRDRVRSPVVLLNLMGVVLVGAALVPKRVGTTPVVPTVLGGLALVGWALWAMAAPGRRRDGALLVGSLAAAIGAGLGSPSLIAPLIAAVLLVVADPAHTVRPLAAYVAVVTIALSAAAVGSGMALQELLSLAAGIAFGVLGGITRRQRRLADLQRDALIATSLAAERDAARAQLLEARGVAARDVHDVLAHSLGGLVLQLDAIEALLERGHLDEAAVRAGAARGLAAEGLAEARRAVATLRDPDATLPPPVPDDVLHQLVDAHRRLGATVRLTGDPSLHDLGPAHRAALAAVLREALANAGRHAPGTVVDVDVRREPHAMVLQVANAAPVGHTASVGGGHGLVGMRERFAALADGSRIDAGRRDDRFVVVARAVLP
ncbi:MAG: two-component sensor histidine kinase [Acidobacteria bacterium]|nr:two-component sensor histidine kinase [Acidobacteriota bacterium]